MNNKFVIGDIHGGLKALEQVIDKANVSNKDTIIFLGDYVDGWSESPQVLDYLIQLKQSINCVFIKGNHDDLLLNYLKTKTYSEEWFLHGGKSTIDAYESLSEEIIQKHVSFLEQLQDYYLDSNNRLFIHAGYTNVKGVAFEYFKPLYYWDRTLWEMVLALDKNLDSSHLFYPNRLKLYTEIYIGHTPTTKIDSFLPVNKANVWNIDTGAAFKGKLTLLNIHTKEYWQSDSLPELYPSEKGRN